MKKTKPKVVVKCNNFTNKYEVWLVNGVQSFQFHYTGTQAECLWYKRMLKKAGVP